MSAPAPAAPPLAKLKLPYMTGYEHFILSIRDRVKALNPERDYKEVFKKSAEIWTMLAPCEKMYWDKHASDAWDQYTRNVLEFANWNPQHYELDNSKRSNTTPHNVATQGATVQGCVAKGVRSRNYGGQCDMETGTSFKSYLYCGDDPKPEVRRFHLNNSDSYKFASLQSTLREIYQLKSQKFTIAWKDEDGDEVIMSSDGEVRTMLSEGRQGVLKLVVRCEKDARAQALPEFQETPAISTATGEGGLPDNLHKGVTCDGCGNAVIGHRYKCISCDNFDLCAKCESAGKHPEHCVVRVPLPNMSVPLLKATIKKSRRFLKSVASNAIEESRKLRRERRHSSEPNTQGKQDSQPRTCVSWIEVFTKYMDEFANIAGNMAYCPESDAKTTEAATSTESRSGETSTHVPTAEQNAQNPRQLPVVDLTSLQRVCEFMRDNNIGETANEAMRYLAHAYVPEENSRNDASNLIQAEKDVAEASASRQEMIFPQAPEPQESTKNQGISQPDLAPTQALSDLAKMDQSEIMKIASGQAAPESAGLKDVKRDDISELVKAVNKCEVSSNASSCSEGNGSEKVEGWTVVDADNLLKDDIPEASAKVEGGPLEGQEPIRQQAPLYPPLNAATAVLNPKESDVVAPAPAASTTAPKTEKPAKQAVCFAEDLRSQIAPHVEAALHQMEAMGFSNESGWLTQLLDHHDGNIAVVLDLIAPVKNPNAPSAPNASNPTK